MSGYSFYSFTPSDTFNRLLNLNDLLYTYSRYTRFRQIALHLTRSMFKLHPSSVSFINCPVEKFVIVKTLHTSDVFEVVDDMLIQFGSRWGPAKFNEGVIYWSFLMMLMYFMMWQNLSNTLCFNPFSLVALVENP